MNPRPDGPLVGRDDELARLDDTLRAVAGGSGACVIVEGSAGMGKSRLLDEAGRRARGMGMAVAEARATELDRIAPLTTLLMALRSSAPAVLDEAGVARLDVLRTQQGNAFWVINQLSLGIEQYAASRPLLISLDDLQWADELTALALRILVPTLATTPVLWLLASRPRAGRSAVHDIVDWLVAEGAQRLRLGSLADEAMVALCTHILGAPPTPRILGLAERAGGNPLLLEELITAFGRNGWRGDQTPPAEGDGVELPRELLESVDLRLRTLSRTARQILDAGAVLGRAFTVSDAAGMIGCRPDELHQAVAEIVEDGILTGAGAELEFRHDLIRDAVYSRLPESARRSLHREASRVLLGKSRPVMEIAPHLLRCARQGDASTISLLRQAALDLGPTAPSTAADLMLQVLALLDDQDPSRPSLTATTVRLLAAASRLSEAKELGEAALRFRLAEGTQAAMLLGLAEALKHAGQDRAAVEYTERALCLPVIPGSIQAQLLAVQAHALLAEGDPEGADRAGVRAIEVGTGCDQHSAVVTASAARSAVAQSRGQIADAIARAAEAVQLADLTAGEARQRQPRLWLARALVASDRFADAESAFELGEREARELGAVWSLPLWHLYHAELHLAAGDLDNAQARAESGVALSDQLTARALAPALFSLLSRIALHRGELAAADEHLERARRALRDAKGEVAREPESLLWTQALLHEAAGDEQATAATLAPIYAGLPRRVLLLTTSPGVGPHLVRAAMNAGDVERAQLAAAAAQRVAELNPHIASLTGAAAQAEGLLRQDLEALRDSVRRLEASPRALIRASALEDAAAAERRAGEESEAVSLLQRAHEHYAACGARRDAERVERRLRRLGVRRKTRRPRNRAKTGLASLTESELRVVDLVAEGLTNRAIAKRLYLSPHTVDAHLRHSFSKLGVSSRVELTRTMLLHKTGALEEPT
jgi:ATP/maltotriose-dependent transcriptional regulator MalT